jgi:hypothetical protein
MKFPEGILVSAHLAENPRPRSRLGHLRSSFAVLRQVVVEHVRTGRPARQGLEEVVSTRGIERLDSIRFGSLLLQDIEVLRPELPRGLPEESIEVPEPHGRGQRPVLRALREEVRLRRVPLEDVSE